MKIRDDARIQAEVDKRTTTSLNRLAALTVAAGGELNDSAPWKAHQDGVEAGVALVKAYDKAVEKRQKTDSIFRNVGKIPPTYGVFRAQVLTSDGQDTLYFIGFKDEILKKIKAVSEGEPNPDRI